MRRILGLLALRLFGRWQHLRCRLYTLAVSGAFRSFGRRSYLSLPVRLHAPEFITVGANVFFGADCWLQALPQPGKPSPELVVGEGTKISGTCVLSAARSIVLEKQVLLARNVYISDHIHAYSDTGKPVLAQGLEKIAPVVIEAGAWLGQNVVVCPGVRIGRGSVIGANSVVNTDVPPYSVAVGAPARVVKCFGEPPDDHVSESSGRLSSGSQV